MLFVGILQVIIAKVREILHRIWYVGVDDVRVGDAFDFVCRMETRTFGHVVHERQYGATAFEKFQRFMQKFDGSEIIVHVIITSGRCVQIGQQTQNAIEAGIAKYQRIVTVQKYTEYIGDVRCVQWSAACITQCAK